MRMLLAFIFSTALPGLALAQMYSNHCDTKRAEGYVASICRGGSIPINRTRNFHYDSQRLECTSNSDTFVRRPQTFDLNEWLTLSKSGDARQEKEAFELRRRLPLIQWQGTIPYETVEVWSWESCELETDPQCGSHQECHNETQTDSKGKSTTVRVCVDVTNECYIDVTNSEEQHCSNETMTYNAQFVRDNDPKWQPDDAVNGKVAQILPNKYDLLPGEVENVETMNSSGRETNLNPSAKVLNAWNKYEADVSGSAVGAACRQGQTYHADYQIHTLGRKMGKRAPNPFTMPTDVDGNKVDPFGDQWIQASDAKGKLVKARPRNLMLADSSAAMIQSISEISRKSVPREIKRIKEGKGSNQDGAHLGSPDPLSKEFFKNTQVRVQLYQVNRLWFDTQTSYGFKLSDKNGVQPSMNALSDKQEVAFADQWLIPLDVPNNPQLDLYKSSMAGLSPDRVYEIHVSTYQRNVPFYAESCEDRPKQLGCLGIGMPFPFHMDNAVFSDPIKVRFETPKDLSQRTGLQKFVEFENTVTTYGLNHLFDWIVHQRTTGANQ